LLALVGVRREQGNVLPMARPAAPTTFDCGLINPSFEE
jgi:hypothetical protein